MGWVQSAHGIRGELYIRLHAGSADWIDRGNTRELFLLTGDAAQLKGYEATQIKPHKEGLIVRLKEIADRNAAELIEKSQVYIPESYLKSKPGEAIYLNEIIGFTVSDKTEGELGTVSGFSSNGPQDLLQITLIKGGEALVPLVDAFLVHIDFDKKLVSMDLPPGLISLEEE